MCDFTGFASEPLHYLRIQQVISVSSITETKTGLLDYRRLVEKLLRLVHNLHGKVTGVSPGLLGKTAKHTFLVIDQQLV